VERRAPAERVAYLDNLKLVLVATIIAGHGALAYGDLESAWPYQDVQEVQLAEVSNVTLSAVVIPAALFAMGLFFLISGIVTPGSLSRKGPGRFARDRLIRLGAPLVAWTLVIWPGAIWAANLAAGETHSFWWWVMNADPVLDTGPLWFVEVLLIYSLAYAAWRSWRAPAEQITRAVSAHPAALSGQTLVALAAAISAATVLVRVVFPAASGQIGQSHLWQWPQFVARQARSRARDDVRLRSPGGCRRSTRRDRGIPDRDRGNRYRARRGTPLDPMGRPWRGPGHIPGHRRDRVAEPRFARSRDSARHGGRGARAALHHAADAPYGRAVDATRCRMRSQGRRRGAATRERDRAP
jgi:hypothetical protein